MLSSTNRRDICSVATSVFLSIVLVVGLCPSLGWALEDKSDSPAEENIGWAGDSSPDVVAQQDSIDVSGGAPEDATEPEPVDEGAETETPDEAADETVQEEDPATQADGQQIGESTEDGGVSEDVATEEAEEPEELGSSEGESETEEDSDDVEDDVVLEEADAGYSIETATPLALNSLHSDTIVSSDEYYKFTLPYSGMVRINLTCAKDPRGYYYRDSDLWVRDASGTSLRHTTWELDQSQDTQSISWGLDLTKGVYYVEISWFWAGDYTIEVDFTNANESFAEAQGGSNNSMGTASAISMGTSYNGQIAINDEVDYYRFTCASAGKSNISIVTYMWGNNFSIYDSSGNQVWSNSQWWPVSTGDPYLTVRHTLSWGATLSKGTYYLCVEGDGGQYSFNLGKPASGGSTSYVVRKKVTGGGTIELQSSTMYPAAGATVVFRTLPNAGQTLSKFNVTYTDPATSEQRKLTTGNGITRTAGTGAPGTKSEYSFKMPARDVYINATFVANTKTYAITKAITGTGKSGSNLMLVGSDGKVAGKTSDTVAPTMYPRAGKRVYFKSVPASGAKLTKFNVTYSYTGLDGASHSVKYITGSGITGHGGGLYSFVMPCYPVKLTGEFTSTTPTQYKAIISAYKSALSSSATPDYNVVNIEAWAARDYTSFGYAYYDVNGDGNVELLIGAPNKKTTYGITGDQVGYCIYDMYTIVNGKAVRTFSQTEMASLGYRAYCIPCKNRYLITGGSGGMYSHSIKFSRMGSVAVSSSMQTVDSIEIDSDKYTFYNENNGTQILRGATATTMYYGVLAKYTPVTSLNWHAL